MASRREHPEIHGPRTCLLTGTLGRLLVPLLMTLVVCASMNGCTGDQPTLNAFANDGGSHEGGGAPSDGGSAADSGSKSACTPCVFGQGALGACCVQ